MCGPVNGLGNFGSPAITVGHFLEEEGAVCCVADRCLETAVDRNTCYIERNRTGRGQGDNGTIVSKRGSVIGGMSVGFDVELGKKGEIGKVSVIVLVAFNVFVGGDNGSGLNGADDSFDGVEVRLEERIGDLVTDFGLFQDSVYESGVVGREGACNTDCGMGPFHDASEETGYAEHTLAFSSE